MPRKTVKEKLTSVLWRFRANEFSTDDAVKKILRAVEPKKSGKNT